MSIYGLEGVCHYMAGRGLSHYVFSLCNLWEVSTHYNKKKYFASAHLKPNFKFFDIVFEAIYLTLKININIFIYFFLIKQLEGRLSLKVHGL